MDQDIVVSVTVVMTRSVDDGLSDLSLYELDGVAHNCKHGNAAARAGAGPQPITQFEAPAFTRGPSSKKKHTYVWQCVSKNFSSLVRLSY